MKIKRAIAALVALVLVLVVAGQALALSLGVSPTRVEFEVPGDGSAVVDFQVHYFSGDVRVSLVDIPLRVEPETIHVDASSEPVDVEFTIYGDEALGSEVYDGYIRFIAVSGGSATGGVQVIARVTNVVESETPVPAELPEEEVVVLEEEAAVLEEQVVLSEKEAAPEEDVMESAQLLQVKKLAEETALAPSPPEPTPVAPSTALPVAGIFAGAAVAITLVVVLVRRREY